MDDLTLGRIAFINVMPVYYALEHGITPNPFHLVYGTPAELNEKMQAGQLTVSSCSCMEYARRWRNYRLARDLSIASSGPVLSVLLLSKEPPASLDGAHILASGQSHTSVVLTRLLFQERYKVKVSFSTGNVRQAIDQKCAPEAVLTIGDEALSLRHHPDYPHVTDLAMAWREWTGLPFVFALWIINPERARAFQGDPSECIRQSRDWGLSNLKSTLPTVEKKSPLSRTELEYYYTTALKFSLSQQEIAGLKLFYSMITEAKLLEEEPELNFF